MGDQPAYREELLRRYPLCMGRYLTEAEREDILRLIPDTGPDWSDWRAKLDSGQVRRAVREVWANEDTINYRGSQDTGIAGSRLNTEERRISSDIGQDGLRRDLIETVASKKGRSLSE